MLKLCLDVFLNVLRCHREHDYNIILIYRPGLSSTRGIEHFSTDRKIEGLHDNAIHIVAECDSDLVIQNNAIRCLRCHPCDFCKRGVRTNHHG